MNNTPLVKLPFDEALFQTYNFLTNMEKSMQGTFSLDDIAAVRQTNFILSKLIVQYCEDNPTAIVPTPGDNQP
ncbi:hypothetical protein [Nitrospira sp. BLG_2]|uniref:hypothetical protein n=1 Tax=Nitrospira sp. BLG_2 TaxID=3397507 RepID=UPI003B9CE8BB